jgi:hypothetical protein
MQGPCDKRLLVILTSGRKDAAAEGCRQQAARLPLRVSSALTSRYSERQQRNNVFRRELTDVTSSMTNQVDDNNGNVPVRRVR